MCDFFNNICSPKTSYRSLSFSSLSEPTIYEESMEMLAAALTIYIYADLRDLARAGKACSTLDNLEPPMEYGRMLKNIKTNQKALTDSGEYDELEQRLHALENLYKHNEGSMLDNMMGNSKSSQLVQFYDTNAKNEMVHAVTVNTSRKRITVIFRGSVTTTDFLTDAKLFQQRVDNPVRSIDEKSPETIGIHSGFLEYLFGKDSVNEGKNRFESIIFTVKTLLKSNPGFSVYCTGHSLGGALSSLFGFYAAADNEIINLTQGRPVRVFSIASPYVGNTKFLLAFQGLERAQRIQYLRIANAEDVVTLMPVISPKIGALSPLLAVKQGAASLYKHCGIKLHLNPVIPETNEKQIYQLSYPQDHSSDEHYAKEIERIIEDGKNFFSSMKKDVATITKYHSCEEYELRLNACKEELSGMTIDSMYKDKGLVGNILDPGYEPQMMTGLGSRVSRIMESESLRNTIKKQMLA